MSIALDELIARLDEIQADSELVNRAIELGPRLGKVLDWKVSSKELSLAKTFIGSDFGGSQRLNGGLYVRASAALERYLRRLLEDSVAVISDSMVNIEDVPEPLRRRNIVLTGRVLSSLDTPTDHLQYEYDTLISNLASCTPGSPNFILNSEVFAELVTSAKPVNVDKALKSVKKVDSWWPRIAGVVELQNHLKTKGVVATQKAVTDRLDEVCRIRNQIAHGGDEEKSITYSELGITLAFITALARAIDEAFGAT